MHETNTSTTEQPNDLEQPQETTLEYAKRFVDDITASELFIQSAYDTNISLDETSNDDYISLLASTTDIYVEQFADDLAPEETIAIQVLGHTPYALRKKQLLDIAKSESVVSHQEVSNAKDALIQYNSLISDLLTTMPDQPLETLSQVIASAGIEKIEISSDDARRYSMETLRGIRTENTFKQIIESTGVINIRHGNTQEERKGIDFVLSGDDGTDIKIDIKSSLDQIASKNGGYSDQAAYAYKNGVFTYFPYLIDDRFVNNSSILDPETVSLISPQILGDVFRMHQQSIDNYRK